FMRVPPPTVGFLAAPFRAVPGASVGCSEVGGRWLPGCRIGLIDPSTGPLAPKYPIRRRAPPRRARPVGITQKRAIPTGRAGGGAGSGAGIAAESREEAVL